MWQMASCTNTASKVRPKRNVRMSPSRCSHSGLSALLTESMPDERSTSVIAKRALRWEALFPPPDPSSNTRRGAGWHDSVRTRATNAASSLYSSGGEKIGHHSASSLYSFIELDAIGRESRLPGLRWIHSRDGSIPGVRVAYGRRDR